MKAVDDVVAAIAAATARDRALIAARKGEAMARPGGQLEALIDLARALEGAGVPYALIGGIAVGIHAGSPRATADIDICVSTSVERDALVSALSAAGFSRGGEFAHSVNFRHTSGEPVQVVFDPAFDAMIERAEDAELGGVMV